MTIHLKILIVILLVIAITGTSSILISRELSQNALEHQIHDQLVAANNAQTHHITTYISNLRAATESTAIQTEIFSLMLEETGEFSPGMMDYIMNVSTAEDQSHVFIADEDGNLIWGTGRYGLQMNMVNETQTSMDNWEALAEGINGTCVMDTHLKEYTEDIVIATVSPFYTNNEPAGAVIIIGGEEGLAAITTDYEGFGETGEVYVVNKEGYILTPSRFLQAGATPKVDLKADPIESASNIIRHKNYMGIEVISVYSSIPETEWTVVAEISAAEAFAPVSDLTDIMIWILAVILTLGAIISIIVSRVITKPVRKLHHGVDQIMNGNLNCRIENTGNDEMGQLSQAFNDMSDNLAKSQKETKDYADTLELKVGERTAELEATDQELRAVNQQLEAQTAQLEEEIAEKELTQNSLYEKHEELTAAEQELRAINQQLEERVYQRTTELADSNKLLCEEIEERKSMHLTLKESEDKYRCLFEHANDALFIMEVTENGAIFSDCNNRTLKLFGCTYRDQILGKPPTDFSPLNQPDGQASDIEARDLTIAAMEGNPQNFEWMNCRLDGTPFWVDVTLSRIEIKGQYLMQAVVRDITEQKQMKKTLQESEEKLRSILTNFPDFVFTLNRESNLTYMNRDVENHPMEESIGTSILKYIEPLYHESFRHAIDEVFRTGKTVTIEATATPPDGQTRLFENRLGAITINEKVDSLVMIASDITERRQAEEALRESESKYASVVQHAQEGIVIVQDGVYRFVNEGWCRIIGYSQEELLGSDFLQGLSQASKETVAERARRRIEGEDVPPNYEVEMQTISGEYRILEVSAGLIQYEGKPANLGLLRDVTERKHAEENILASLKEKEVLLREIHHRVKNNLQVISSLLYLQASNTSNEEVLTMFADSRNRVGSMALVHEKLYQSQDLSAVNFSDYIQSLADQLVRSCGRPEGVELIVDAEDVSLDIDSAIPCGLIINELLINAFKHAFPTNAGAVNETRHEDKIRIEFSENEDQKYTLKVSDNGVGMPADIDIENTDSLGMQLVSTLTDQLEGILEINGKEGTEFKIEFANHNAGKEVLQNGQIAHTGC